MREDNKDEEDREDEEVKEEEEDEESVEDEENGEDEKDGEDEECGGLSWNAKFVTTLDSLRLEGVWRWSDRLDATVKIQYESFATEDWALQDVAPDTLTTVLTLGAEPYDYNVWLVGVGFRFRFGDRDIALAN